MAKGYVKLEFIDGGLACSGHLHEVDFFDKAALVSGLFASLKVSMDDSDQLAALIALGSMLNKHASKVKVDAGTIQEALRRVKGDGSDVSDGDADE